MGIARFSPSQRIAQNPRMRLSLHVRLMGLGLDHLPSITFISRSLREHAIGRRLLKSPSPIILASLRSASCAVKASDAVTSSCNGWQTVGRGLANKGILRHTRRFLA